MKDFAKADWKAAPLGEVAQIRPNKKEAKSVLADDDEVSFVPMDCLKVDQVALSEHEAKPLGKVYGGYTYFRDGDVLLAKITPCFENGKLGIANDLTNGVGFGSSEFFVLRPSEKLLAGYLYHFLNRQSFRDWAKGQMTGAVGHKRVPKELIESLDIPLPPLEEQQRIVAVLDEAFEDIDRARAHAEANLLNARELLALTFEHELLKHKDASRRTTIGEACTDFEYGTSSKSQPEGKMPVLRMGNLQSGEIDWNDLVYTDSDADIEKLKLNEGDILFNRTNSLEHVGKTAIYRGDMPAIFAGYLIRVHHDRSTLLPEFLNMFLNSTSAREYGRSISGKSVNQANISASKLKTYPILLPSVEAQESIVRKTESLRGPLKDLESNYEVKKQDIDDLRQSLLQKAFAGELT